MLSLTCLGDTLDHNTWICSSAPAYSFLLHVGDNFPVALIGCGFGVVRSLLAASSDNKPPPSSQRPQQQQLLPSTILLPGTSLLETAELISFLELASTRRSLSSLTPLEALRHGSDINGLYRSASICSGGSSTNNHDNNSMTATAAAASFAVHVRIIVSNEKGMRSVFSLLQTVVGTSSDSHQDEGEVRELSDNPRLASFIRTHVEVIVVSSASSAHKSAAVGPAASGGGTKRISGIRVSHCQHCPLFRNSNGGDSTSSASDGSSGGFTNLSVGSPGDYGLNITLNGSISLLSVAPSSFATASAFDASRAFRLCSNTVFTVLPLLPAASSSSVHQLLQHQQQQQQQSVAVQKLQDFIAATTQQRSPSISPRFIIVGREAGRQLLQSIAESVSVPATISLSPHFLVPSSLSSAISSSEDFAVSTLALCHLVADDKNSARGERRSSINSVNNSIVPVRKVFDDNNNNDESFANCNVQTARSAAAATLLPPAYLASTDVSLNSIAFSDPDLSQIPSTAFSGGGRGRTASAAQNSGQVNNALTPVEKSSNAQSTSSAPPRAHAVGAESRRNSNSNTMPVAAELHTGSGTAAVSLALSHVVPVAVNNNNSSSDSINGGGGGGNTNSNSSVDNVNNYSNSNNNNNNDATVEALKAALAILSAAQTPNKKRPAENDNNDKRGDDDTEQDAQQVSRRADEAKTLSLFKEGESSSNFGRASSRVNANPLKQQQHVDLMNAATQTPPSSRNNSPNVTAATTTARQQHAHHDDGGAGSRQGSTTRRSTSSRHDYDRNNSSSSSIHGGKNNATTITTTTTSSTKFFRVSRNNSPSNNTNQNKTDESSVIPLWRRQLALDVPVKVENISSRIFVFSNEDKGRPGATIMLRSVRTLEQLKLKMSEICEIRPIGHIHHARSGKIINSLKDVREGDEVVATLHGGLPFNRNDPPRLLRENFRQQQQALHAVVEEEEGNDDDYA